MDCMICPQCGDITRLIDDGVSTGTIVYYCVACNVKIPRLAPRVEAQELVSKFNKAHIVTAKMVLDHIATHPELFGNETDAEGNEI